MTDSQNRIEVDASFFHGIDGANSVRTNFVAQGLNFKGYKNIPTLVLFETADTSFNDTLVNVQAVQTTSGTVSRLVNFNLYTSTTDVVDAQVQYNSIGAMLSGTINKQVAYTLLTTLSPNFVAIPTIYTAGRNFLGYEDTHTTLMLLNSRTRYINTLTNYTNYTGYNDFYYEPLPAWHGETDIETFYTAGSGTIVGWDKLVEIFFAGWVPHNIYLDIYCSIQQHNSVIGDLVLVSGSKYGVYTSCYACALSQIPIEFDLICSLTGYIYTTSDVHLTPGAKYGIQTNLYSSNMLLDSLLTDINLFPIYFDDFSLNVGEYTHVSNSICLDAHDGRYTLVASGTYLKINDIQVSGTLTDLADGYRICYNPDDDFYSLSGLTKFTAHAENNMGDILEEDFYLTFGYIVEFDNKNNIGLDYGFGNRVSVRIEAENLASCPSSISEGYWFVSEEIVQRDLSATIICQGAVTNENENLSASIYPHSTAYFYDKEMKVVLTAKDFNGNTMEPFVLEFKIRNDAL